MLSKSEYMREAERAAAHRFGERNEALFTFRRLYAAPLAVLTVAGLIGYGGYWLWNRAAEIVPTPDLGTGSFPMAYVVVVGILAVLSVVAMRSPSAFPVVLIKAVVLLTAWLGVFGYGLFLWLG